MIIIVIIYLSHFFTHMHVQDAKRYLIRIVCVYCCAELVNLRHDSVYICVCVCVCILVRAYEVEPEAYKGKMSELISLQCCVLSLSTPLYCNFISGK